MVLEAPATTALAVVTDLVPSLLTISATTSALISSELVYLDIEVAARQTSIVAITRPVSTFVYGHTFAPVGPAICNATVNNIVAQLPQDILSVSASTQARIPSELIFVQAIQANIQAKAAFVPHQVDFSISSVNATCDIVNVGERVSVSPRIVISARTNPIIHEIAIDCPPVLASTTFRMGKISEIVAVPLPSLSAETSVGSFVPSFISPILSIQANAQAKSTENYLSILTSQAVAMTGIGLTPGGPPAYQAFVTAQVGVIEESLFAFAIPAPVMVIAAPTVPTMEIAVSGVSATTLASDTWGAGVAMSVHCWMTLGVISLEILSTWEPGQGVKFRGKSDGIRLKGISDEVKLRGKDESYFVKGKMINIY